MQKFVLIDGNAILHRAFHALPPLTNSKGELTNAVYGFSSMLLKIMDETKPTHIAVCFDRAKPTFRKQLYVGYQAHRPKMDDGLTPQIGMVHEVLERMKIPIFELDGYEADDLIGTLAKQATEINTNTTNVKYQINTNKKEKKKKIGLLDIGNLTFEIIIVSGDRDMLQLVNHRVKILAPIIGITKMIMFDGKIVEEKYGIKPEQVVDFKALVGDSSDNYPGITGIGPKTASELLREYGSLESLYENIKELPPKISEKLAKDAEQAALAKKLAQIVTNAPVTLDINACLVKNIDWKEAKKVFEKHEFKSLVKRMEDKGKPATTEDIEKDNEDTEKQEKTVVVKKKGEQLDLL